MTKFDRPMDRAGHKVTCMRLKKKKNQFFYHLKLFKNSKPLKTIQMFQMI